MREERNVNYLSGALIRGRDDREMESIKRAEKERKDNDKR